jgi:hypothetical protein
MDRYNWEDDPLYCENHPSYLIPILALIGAFTLAVILTTLCIIFG